MSAVLGKESEIYHVVYSSVAIERLPQSDLLELLKVSRRNNEERGLSGMLLYRDGVYLQHLEGARDQVNGLLKRLRKDPRHKTVKIVRAGTIPERVFPGWTMAYKSLSGLRSSQVSGYSERLQGHFAPEGDDDRAQPLVDILEEQLTRRHLDEIRFRPLRNF